jgi:hypothetical protein
MNAQRKAMPGLKQLPLLCALVASLLPVAALAQTSDDFYRGKTLTIDVGFGPGGGYDLWARTIARHIARHIPGTPAVVVQNMPGAGSLTALSRLYTTAPKDGTVLAAVARAAVLGPLVPPYGMGAYPQASEKSRWHRAFPPKNKLHVSAGIRQYPPVRGGYGAESHPG